MGSENKGYLHSYNIKEASKHFVGPNGVEATHMPKINEYECSLLQHAAIAIENSIEIGTSYVTGEKARKPQINPKIPTTCEPVQQLDASKNNTDIDPLQSKLCLKSEEKPEQKLKKQQVFN